MKPRILALDVEGTLLVHQGRWVHCRSGLFDFLAWALSRFERVPFYTLLSEAQTRHIFELLSSQGDVPADLMPRFEFVVNPGWGKDLTAIEGAELDEIRLVDDSPGNILEDQRHLWLPIKSFRGPQGVSSAFGATEPDPPDTELQRIQTILTQQLAAND
ncbi:MAG: NIF family HAD-type phosphatase [bacterium]|nr:NIF family HAD-type phosphatase [bacterium]